MEGCSPNQYTRDSMSTGAKAHVRHNARKPWLCATLWLLATAAGAQSGNVEVVGQIGGLCETGRIHGNYAYIGEGPNLTVLDVSDPTSPVAVARVLTSDGPADVSFSGNLAFVAARFDGLLVIDISDPTAPVLLASFPTPTAAMAVDASGELVAVVDPTAGLLLVDVTDPTAPVLVGGYDTPDYAEDVALWDDVAYLANGRAGLFVLNVANPSTPTLYHRLWKYGELDVERVHVANGLAYLACAEYGIKILDLTYPHYPFLLSSYSTRYNVTAVHAFGETALVLDLAGNLHVVDVSDPNYPVFRGAYEPDGYAGSTHSVDADGQRAYITTRRYGFLIVDVSSPSTPTLVGKYDRMNAVTFSEDVEVKGGLAYVADWLQGLRVIDISDPTRPALVGAPEQPSQAWRVKSDGSQLYLSADGGMSIMDISNPLLPKNVGTAWIRGGIEDLHIESTRAYLAEDHSGLEIFDVRVPSNPVRVGLYGGITNHPVAVDVVGHTAYVASRLGYPEEDGLLILDVTDPSSPTLRGQVGRNGSDVHVTNHTAYFIGSTGTNDPGGFAIIDVSDPEAPALLASRPGAYTELTVSGGMAYLVWQNHDNHTGGLHLFDVTNPASPIRRASFDVLRQPSSIRISDGLIYLTEEFRGLWVLRYTGPMPDVANLTVEGFDFSPTVVTPDGGEAISFSGMLRNSGGTAAPARFWVEFRVWPGDSFNPAGPYLCDSWLVTDSLAPGEGIDLATLPVRTTYPLPAGEYRVGVVIDPLNEIDEKREDDNVAWVSEKTLRVGPPKARTRAWMLYQ